MATSTSVKTNQEDDMLMVKIANNVIDIKNCIKDGIETGFRIKTIIKYRGDFYIIFRGEDKFPEGYVVKYFREIDHHDIGEDGKLKRSSTIGEDNFTGFAMTEKTLDMYIRSLNGSTVESDSDDSESSECACCRAYVWKVEVPNSIHRIKKLLRTALCHYSNNCIPIGVYYQNNPSRYFIMFKSNGLDPIACVAREKFQNFSFSNKDPDGDRITRLHRYRFAMKHDEFWDYVENLLEEFKKQHEKEGKDVCE